MLNENWKILDLRGSNGMVDYIGFECEFTSADYPGVTDERALGAIDVAPLPYEGSTQADFVNAVKAALGAERWNEMLAFHDRQLAFRYKEISGEQFDTSAFTPPSPPTERDYADAIQRHLDATASQRRYDNIQTAVTYRDDPNPVYAAEANALFTWRSNVWTYALAELEKVKTGQRAQPTIPELIAELPAFAWPQ